MPRHRQIACGATISTHTEGTDAHATRIEGTSRQAELLAASNVAKDL